MAGACGDGIEGGGVDGGGHGGTTGGMAGGGDGKAPTMRAPQSAQSVPKSQMDWIDPGPPS